MFMIMGIMVLEAQSRFHVAIPLVAIKEVSNRFDNTLYGYFIGMRLAFPIFENYVKTLGKASTSQPNEKKEPSAPHPNNKGKDVSDLQEINIFSLRNSFDALMEKDKFFEVNNETWKASNDVGSILDDIEEVKNVFMEDNRKPIDCLVDDARKKVEAPPKKNPMNWYLIG
ncbi:hypothetical protein Tco_1564468 [Tanacetum coccineum]